MRDVIDFPVVGSRPEYLESNEWRKTIKTGSVLNLVPDPSNPKDQYAIKVMFSGERIGYVPNRGITCMGCLSNVGQDDHYCQKCGANWDEFEEGGLSFRLRKKNIFAQDFACLVKEINWENSSQPVTATVVT